MPHDLAVIALQTDIVWENPKGNREKIEKMVSTVAVCDIVVLPEMFTTGFQPKGMNLAETMNGETVQWMKNLAQQRNFVVAGSIIVHENEKLYNRFIWAFPDGKTEFYDKRHLFSYGKEHLHYAAGQKRVVLEYKGWRILPQICYDLRFPVWSRNQNDYDLAVYVASWPQPRTWVWEHLLVARAIENQAYVVGVNRVGVDGFGLHYDGKSKIIDPTGSVISPSENPVEQVLQATLNYQTLTQWRNAFPALSDRDEFAISL
jgi:predicted amidohydrolase